MSDDELAEFSKNFHGDIRGEALALDALREEVFVQKIGEIIEEYGEIDDLIPCSYQSNKGMKVDGYTYDDEFKDFTLIVSLYTDEDDISKASVPPSQIDKTFKRAVNFFKKSLTGLHKNIEIANEAHDLARLLFEAKKDIRNVKVVLITDGITKKKPAEVEIFDDFEFKKVVWDIERACHYYQTGERERITIDFERHLQQPLKCVELERESRVYSTYLGFIPGEVLADMYEMHGTKMLDMNVRVFLSARGNVNKGIRRTIIEEPEMFCAYNNGITVSARNVVFKNGASTSGIIKAEDFQIINGGQTTASLYHTRKKDKADLSKVAVQMKLTVIDDEALISELLPQISEFSNTQNKVQMADLAANQAPHPEVQAVSKQIQAPDPTGGAKQTYWFYERARGSYEEWRNLTAKTPAQKRKFDELRPKKQKFDKIKFGKVWNAYLKLPHIVSLGAQKNFGRFNKWLQEQEGEDWVAFFRKTVALMILWNRMERIIRANKYAGYHHNIIAYTLSWFFQLTDSRIDLEKIWKNQDISEVMSDTLDSMSMIVNEHIRDTKANVTEYCKKEECWDSLKNMPYDLDYKIEEDYFSAPAGHVFEPNIKYEEDLINFCKEKGPEAWFALAVWLKERQFLTPKARSQCFNMGMALKKNKESSKVLSFACKKIWNDAEQRGWEYKELVSEAGLDDS
ncbi:MAG: AIPR family protein [Thermoleophilia bacterium]